MRSAKKGNAKARKGKAKERIGAVSMRSARNSSSESNIPLSFLIGWAEIFTHYLVETF